MYRTHTCGQLRMENVNESVCLSGWVQKVRKLGAMTFVDLRDRYGITQLVVEESAPEEIKANVAKLGREFVIQVKGTVIERASKNNKIPTGDIEIIVNELNVLSESNRRGGRDPDEIPLLGFTSFLRSQKSGITPPHGTIDPELLE